MSVILKHKSNHTLIGYINDFEKVSDIKEIYYKPNKNPSWITSSGGIFSSCIHCLSPRCITYDDTELNVSNNKLNMFPIDGNNQVCPVRAISWDREKNIPVVKSENCILCGVCISRCPFGAIYLRDNVITIANNTNDIITSDVPNAISMNKQNNQIKRFMLIDKKGCMVYESDKLFTRIYDKILNLKGDQQIPNLIARNLLLEINNRCCIRRIGDTYVRIDGLLDFNPKCGVLEIDFQSDVMSLPRSILDDVAVLSSRYGVDKKDIIPFIIMLEFPNTRTEYWRVINDISKVLNLKINSITIGMLMLLVWNFKTVDLSSTSFYMDIYNLSRKEIIVNLLKRNININDNNVALFQPKK